MIRVEPRNANSAIFSYGVPILSAVVALILAKISATTADRMGTP